MKFREEQDHPKANCGIPIQLAFQSVGKLD